MLEIVKLDGVGYEPEIGNISAGKVIRQRHLGGKHHRSKSGEAPAGSTLSCLFTHQFSFIPSHLIQDATLGSEGYPSE